MENLIKIYEKFYIENKEKVILFHNYKKKLFNTIKGRGYQ